MDVPRGHAGKPHGGRELRQTGIGEESIIAQTRAP
jgi:hypothetical protein